MQFLREVEVRAMHPGKKKETEVVEFDPGKRG